MVHKKTPDQTRKTFFKYLSLQGITDKTQKNYRSDTSHFVGWLLFRLRHWGIVAEDLSDAVPLLSPKLASEYKRFLISNQIAVKTINRRLSTLRHLARFLTASQILDFDFMEGLTNIPIKQSSPVHQVIIQFKKHLEAEKISKNTIKNYLSDIKQFISWLEQKQSRSLNKF